MSTGHTPQSGTRPGSWARPQRAGEAEAAACSLLPPAQVSAEAGSSESRLWLQCPSPATSCRRPLQCRHLCAPSSWPWAWGWLEPSNPMTPIPAASGKGERGPCCTSRAPSPWLPISPLGPLFPDLQPSLQPSLPACFCPALSSPPWLPLTLSPPLTFSQSPSQL